MTTKCDPMPERRRRLHPLFILVVAGLLGGACGGGKEQAQPGSPDAVLAKVGPYSITRADLKRRITQLPEAARSSLDDPEKQAILLEQMVDELLIRIAAESRRLDREPEYQRQLEDVKTRLLSAHFNDKVLVPLAMPDSATVDRYFRENPEEFRVAERVTAKQIVVATEAEAQDIRRRLRAGASFESLLPRSIDTQTKNLGGALGYISVGAPVRGIGQNEDFVAAVLAVATGEISAPIRTDKGYHVVRVESREPARERELDAVRPALERRLASDRFKTIGQRMVDSLRARYKVEIDEKALYGEQYREHTAKELFDRAQNTEDATARIRLYEQVVAEHTATKYAAQAQFMIGFIYADELKDKEKASAALQQVIDRYPDSELVDSARWMLKNMDSPTPPLETGEPAAEQGASGAAQTTP